MRQTKYDAIDAALDRYKSGLTKRGDGKVSVVSIAKEACVGRATVYRSFAEHPDLKAKYEDLCIHGASRALEPPLTPHEAFLQTRAELKRLRLELKDVRRRADEQQKLSANMIFVLRRKIELIETENKNLRSRLSQSSVVQLTRAGQSDGIRDEDTF